MNIKKIIAREGLILIICFILWFLFGFLTDRLAGEDTWFALPLLVFGSYLLIRFILWAIKTLKEK